MQDKGFLESGDLLLSFRVGASSIRPKDVQNGASLEYFLGNF